MAFKSSCGFSLYGWWNNRINFQWYNIPTFYSLRNITKGLNKFIFLLANSANIKQYAFTFLPLHLSFKHLFYLEQVSSTNKHANLFTSHWNIIFLMKSSYKRSLSLSGKYTYTVISYLFYYTYYLDTREHSLYPLSNGKILGSNESTSFFLCHFRQSLKYNHFPIQNCWINT